MIILAISGVLTACSIMPNRTTHSSSNIRVIKEEPIRYEYHKKYRSKIEQVDYNSSIIAPEVKSMYKSSRDNKKINNAMHKITTKASSEAREAENKVGSIISRTIDKSLDSVVR